MIVEDSDVKEFVEVTRDLLVDLGIVTRAETAYLCPYLLMEKMRCFDRKNIVTGDKETEEDATRSIKFEEILLP